MLQPFDPIKCSIDLETAFSHGIRKHAFSLSQSVLPKEKKDHQKPTAPHLNIQPQAAQKPKQKQSEAKMGNNSPMPPRKLHKGVDLDLLCVMLPRT